MEQRFINAVRNILGGFRGQWEYDLARAKFGKLSPQRTANVIVSMYRS